jgi:hypothetical protein
MRHSVFVRALAGVLLFSPAATARDDFFGRTVGSFAFEDAEPPVLTGSLEQFFIIFKGPVTFDFLVMSFEITQHDEGPDTLSGAFTFLGADPANTLSGTYQGINFPNDDGVWTGVASWTAVIGTGAFAGLSGNGTLTTALFLEDSSAATAFNGVIVPAPSTAVAALLAFTPLARRRRR